MVWNLTKPKSEDNWDYEAIKDWDNDSDGYFKIGTRFKMVGKQNFYNEEILEAVSGDYYLHSKQGNKVFATYSVKTCLQKR